MSFRLLAVVVGSSLAAGIWSLQPSTPRQQAPVFRSGVELVALDVTVVDNDGVPVTGLTAADFTVTLAGQPRPVRALDYVTFGATPAVEVTPASRETTNDPALAARASRGGRVITLLIDDLSARPGQMKLLITAAERVLPTLDAGDLVGLTTTSGLGPVVNPTRDRSAVLAALRSKGVVGRYDDLGAPFYIAVQEALEIERGMPRETLKEVAARECAIADLREGCQEMVASAARRIARDTVHRVATQLRAYTQVITALRMGPAPRVVIALSTGLAPGADGHYLDLDPLSRAAAEAGVLFYALTEVSDDVDARDVTNERARARREEGAFLTSGVQVVASAAGGEAFRVIGQADRFFKRIVSETSGVYRLGVDMPLSGRQNRFLNAKVTVNRPGLTIRTHRHALMPSAAADAISIDEALKTRIAQGGVAFGVPIALATAVRRERAGTELQLGVNVQMPAGVASPLSAMFALVNETGRVVQAGRPTVTPGAPGEDHRVAFGVPLVPGDYRLRFSIADAHGNIGSVEHNVTARLARFGRVAVSDLFVTWSGDDGRRQFLALEKVPEASSTLWVALELYPDTPESAPDLSVRFALIRVGETAPRIEHETTPVRDGTLLSALLEIPAADLLPGSYTLRATVLDRGSPAGSISVGLRRLP
jgi:VWFA-related protein